MNIKKIDIEQTIQDLLDEISEYKATVRNLNTRKETLERIIPSLETQCGDLEKKKKKLAEYLNAEVANAVLAKQAELDQKEAQLVEKIALQDRLIQTSAALNAELKEKIKIAEKSDASYKKSILASGQRQADAENLISRLKKVAELIKDNLGG